MPDELSIHNLYLNFCLMQNLIHIHFNTGDNSLIIYSPYAENSLHVSLFASTLQLIEPTLAFLDIQWENILFSLLFFFRHCKFVIEVGFINNTLRAKYIVLSN